MAMRSHSWSVLVATVGAAVLLAGTAVPAAASGRTEAAGAAAHLAQAGPPAPFTVIATGLNNPRHLSFGPDGALYVAEAGAGGTSNCTNVAGPEGGEQCVGPTGSITQIANGTQTRVLTGLPSVDDQGSGIGSTGPADVTFDGTNLHVVMQDTDVQTDGSNPFDPMLGQLVTAAPNASPSEWQVGPDFAAYEAANDPDNGAGPGAAAGDPPIDSDPYAITPYNGGFAVADAAGNDLLDVGPAGQISLLAVFPTETQTSLPGDFGPQPVTVPAQAVPTSVVVGPDGALYVGELNGSPSRPGYARVFRIVPGQAPTVYASGFTFITDLAFDAQGRLLVLEADKAGLDDPGQSFGAVIRVGANGLHTELASDGLVFPTGMAVGPDGTIYVSNFGVLPAGAAGAPGGEVIALTPGTAATAGYRTVGQDGKVYNFGDDAATGSLPAIHPSAKVVGIASTPSHQGYWEVTSNGGVYASGDATYDGSMGGKPLASPIVGIAATPDGGGYWMAAADGGVFSFGDARFYGSAGGVKLNKPIVGIAATPDGYGYDLVASDGGIFTYGTANYYGSAGGMALAEPIVGITTTADSGGYWLVASDGGVFSFGDAVFLGSTGGMKINAPIVAIDKSRDGGGYRLFASDGGVFNFGNAPALGSAAGSALSAPVAGAGA
jgi:hypothetical protein